MADRQEEIVERLARIEAKLDTHRQLPERVARLERWQARLTGALALTGSLVAGVAAWLKIPH